MAQKQALRIQELEKQLEQGRKYANETERILRALLISGKSVTLSLRGDFNPSLYYDNSQTLFIEARDQYGAKFALTQNMSRETMAQYAPGPSDYFSESLHAAFMKFWDGIWR